VIRALFLAATMLAVGAAGGVALRRPAPVTGDLAAGVGPAPGFDLTRQDGSSLSLEDLRGKAVVLSFAFTTCGDICPVAIYKLVWMQDQLGEAFGRDVHFVTITVDPVHDTADVLAEYAETIGADTGGWSFLTGRPDLVAQVVRRYGIYAKPATEGGIEHILLTSLIDREGVISVQYLGERFDAKEMLGDLRALMAGNEVSG